MKKYNKIIIAIAIIIIIVLILIFIFTNKTEINTNNIINSANTLSADVIEKEEKELENEKAYSMHN